MASRECCVLLAIPMVHLPLLLIPLLHQELYRLCRHIVSYLFDLISAIATEEVTILT